MLCTKFGWNWHCDSGEEDLAYKIYISSGSGVGNVFSLFRYYLPLEKGQVSSFEKKLNPLHQRMLGAKLVEIDLPGSRSGDKDENVKRL